MGNSPPTASIHILDDDSLLNVFRLYRPFLLGEDEDETDRLVGGKGQWARGRWWYKLAHVCQRWRILVLGSASFLGVSLVCTFGTPVADMLAHSPPSLPLDIDYYGGYINTIDEKEVVLAFKQRDRVRRVRLATTITTLQKVIIAMDGEYPILEYLIMGHSLGKSTIFTFLETLQAPHLRHLFLKGFTFPIGSQFLATAVGLVTLCLLMDQPSSYFYPNTLLQWLSSMPQLESLLIDFSFPVPNRDVERQLTHAPITTPIILPNLHVLRFKGVGTYLEALVHRTTTPRLEKLEIIFSNQLTFSAPRLLQFVSAAENFRFKSAKFEFFDEKVGVEVYAHEEAEIFALSVTINCWHLDWQVSSMVQISSSLSQAFSAVEHLTLEHSAHGRSSEEHNEADLSRWHKLLGSFRNVKTLRIAEGLVEELSRCLRPDDGELPSEMLPELQELTYSRSGDAGDAFTSFVDARQNAGRPIAVIRS